MRVLMSGGFKTQNIVNAIEKQFKASGDDFLVVEFLEDINGIFAKGEYFDKAIIAEQSINRDGSITDEFEIRERINKFAIECASRPRKLSYVFFTPSEKMANMIYEEILPIINYSAVVLKGQPYYANFFSSLIVNDIGQLPPDMVYVPENISMNVEDTVDIDPDIADEDLNADITIPVTNGGVGDDVLGTEGVVGDNEHIGPLGEEEGIDVPDPDMVMPNMDDWIPEDTGDSGDITFDETTDNTGFGDTNGDSWGNFDDQYTNGFDQDDTVVNMDGEYEGARSGDIPDYTEPDMPPIEDDDYMYQNNDNNNAGDGYIPGFDSEEDDIGDDLYKDTNYVPDDSYTPTQEPQFSGEMPLTDDMANGGYGYDPMEQDYDPTGQDLYNLPQDNNNPQQMYGNNDGYGYDDGYGNQQQQPDMQNQGYDPGFAPNDYDIEATATSNRPSRQPMAGRRRKGLSSLLGNRQQEEPSMQMGNQNIGSKDIRKVKDALKPFASKGNSIVVTGCGGCGTSTVAFNLANIISQIGYTVLLVDMDTEGRSQSYISKASYDSMDVEGSNLMSAVNSSTNTNSNATVVKTGFHLLTMGLATDIQPIEEQLHREKIARFVSIIKTGYNFIIYDVPFRHATNFLSDITFMCDNLVLVTDASNWGITKTMLSVCNIESDDIQDTVFRRAQLVFNKYRNLTRLFGLRVHTCDDIVRAMDKKVIDLVGDDVGLQFSRMGIAGIINDDPLFENGWYEDVQYSDTKKGQDIFIDLIEGIVLRKH